MASVNSGNLGGDLKGLLPMPLVIGLTDAVGRRRPILELLEGLYLKVEGGKIVTKPAASEGTLDHRLLLFRDTPDQHPATSISTDVTNFNHNLSATDITVQKALDTLDDLVVPTASTVIPLPDAPVGSAGSNTVKFCQEGHIHPANPAPPPAVLASSTLYTAKIGDPLYKGDIYCTFLGPHTAGANTPMFEGQWTEVSPGVLQRSIAGPLPDYWLDGVSADAYNPSGISSIVGKTVIAYYQGDTSMTGYEEPRQYVFIVDDVGGHFENYGTPSQAFVSTYARMRRHPDFSYSAAWVHNMKFVVQNGTLYGGGTLTFTNSGSFTLGTTFINWAWSSGAPTVTEKWEALTGPQLTTEGALTAVLEQSVSASASTSPQPMPYGFVTIAGTPGVDTLAVGPYRWDVEEVRVSGGDLGSVTFLRGRILDSGTGSELLVFDSDPFSNTSNAPLTWTRYNPSPVGTAPDRLISIVYSVVTNSTTPVTVTMRYNSAARGTKVTLPFNMPVSGAGDGVHNHLSGRDKEVASSDPTNNDSCHPWSALGPQGRIHTKIGTATESGGQVTMPTDASQARLSLAGQYLYMIDSTGFLDGDHVMIYITNAASGSKKYLVDGASPVGNFYGLRLEMEDGSIGTISLVGSTTCKFWLDLPNQCWRLESLPVTHYDP